MTAATIADSIVPGRRELLRLGAAAGALVLVLTVILAVNVSPRLDLQAGDLAPTDIRAPKALTFTNPILTSEAELAARAAVDPQYDYTTAGAIATSTQQLALFTSRVRPIDSAFDPTTTDAERQRILNEALPDLSDEGRVDLLALDAKRWTAVRTEAARILDVTERTELRDTQLA